MNDTNKIGLGIMQLHKRGFLNRTENDADGGAVGLRTFLTQVVNVASLQELLLSSETVIATTAARRMMNCWWRQL